MFTTGSKILIGSSVVAAIAAIAYNVTQTNAMQATVGLVTAALALSFLAGVNVWARDSNISSMDAHAVATAEATQEAPGASVWPLVFAFGLTTVLFGLVTQQSIFTIGVVIALAGGAQWTVQAWADRASVDSAINTNVRSRLANPLEYPLLGAVAVGGIAFSLSRMMLWLSVTNTVIAFVVVATLIASIAFFFAYRPSVKTGAIGGVLAVGAIAIVAGGVAAGVDGQRDIHPHETIGDYGQEICESAEETEADEDVSQTVSIKSNIAAEIILTASGELIFDVPGPVESGATELSLPRSNPNNIIFRNESDHHRRLTLDLGAAEPSDEAAPADEHGEEAAGEEGHAPRNLLCTTLIEEGAAQLLTLTLGVPSIDPSISDDEKAYRFSVPGTDAELGLYVP